MKQYLEYLKICLLGVIAICGILLVIQGFGCGTQKVYVEDGDIDAYVRGNVSVDNTVDVNIKEVIGHTVGCHQSYKHDGEQYWAIDVY